MIVITSILGKSMAPRHISNLVSDVINLLRMLVNIHFNYFNRADNRMAGLLAKRAVFNDLYFYTNE